MSNIAVAYSTKTRIQLPGLLDFFAKADGVSEVENLTGVSVSIEFVILFSVV